ncbi:MAG: glutamyl-tRNA reductase [Bacteroidota bacterium]|nr:glutamyl-tRNA reductase [Bacteroidota bacterium]
MIGLISINFKTSPIEVREKFYFQDNEKMDFFELLSSECPIEGLVILSTCNRTELYYEYENHIGEEKKIFHLIMKCLVKFKKYSEGLSPYVSTKNGSSEVSRHLFRLISGLESMIIGEFQIVDQLKDAFYFAKDKNILGPILERMFQKSFETGKYVRSNTDIGKGAISVSYAAVEMISQNYDIKNTSFLCVGAGETSQLLVKHLLNKDVKEILITNRTELKGKRFAETYDLDTIPYNQMLSKINDVDIVVFSTSSEHPLISKKDIEGKSKKNLLFIDLSVPRNIDDNITEVGNIELINIDNLKDIVNKNYNKRKAEIDKSQKIIDSFLNEFDEWANSRQLRPSILSIKNKIKVLIQNNMNMKSSLSNKEDENINIKMNRVYNKLSDHLVKKIRIASDNGKDKSALEIIKKIFNDE